MIDLTGFISITGQPGLYKIVAQSKNGIIVEGLSDKKRLNIYASTKVSTLTDISMFTTGEDKPLNEIVTAVFEKEKGGLALDNKSDDKASEAYFAGVVPNYDKDRVYVSNMRKLFGWYNTLQSTDNLKTEEENKGKDGEEKSKALKATEAKAESKKNVSKEMSSVKAVAGNKKTTGVRKTGTA